MRNLAAALTAASCFAPIASGDETIRLSSDANGAAGAGASRLPAISADGNVIAFQSTAENLVAGDDNKKSDVFVFDRTTGVLERVSVATNGTQGDGDSMFPSLSADGRYVWFTSEASTLDVDPNGAVSDVFARDRLLGTTTLMSKGLGGAGGNGPSETGQISADGALATFSSKASNLVANDSNGVRDVFVVDVVVGAITIASVASDGTQGDDGSGSPLISADGRLVAFSTYAKNFPDPPAASVLNAVYVKDLTTGALERVDVDSSEQGDPAWARTLRSISEDGALIGFESFTALVPEDGNGVVDLYLRDRHAGTTERVSLASGGREFDRSVGNSIASPDGRFVAMSTDARDVVPDDHNDSHDVFLRDRVLDVTTRVSVGTYDEEGWYSSVWTYGDAISSDAKAVVFESLSPDFVGNDSNNDWDVFLRTRDRLLPSWTRYGAGHPGRGGVVPTMTPDRDPVRSAELSIGVTCSSGFYSAAFVFVGLARASIPTNLGGTLLVDSILVFPIALSPSGGSFTADVPTDYWANGLVVDLQTLELDPYATKGVSFTDGLELVLGDG